MLLKNNLNGLEAIYQTDVDVKISGDYLIAIFICHHPSNFSYSDKYNDDIYCGDVVELFLQTNQPNQYYEIEVSPNNTHFIALITNDGHSFSGQKITEDFVISNSNIIDGIWYCYIKIPLDKINNSKEKGIYYNAFRIDTDGGERDKHLFSLFPTKCGSFHKMDSFKKL